MKSVFTLGPRPVFRQRVISNVYRDHQTQQRFFLEVSETSGLSFRRCIPVVIADRMDKPQNLHDLTIVNLAQCRAEQEHIIPVNLANRQQIK